MAKKYSANILKEVARQYGISPGELSGEAPKVSKELGKTLAQQLYNSPVGVSPQGFNYKTFTEGGKKYYWGGGKVYGEDWREIGDAPESTNFEQVLGGISRALGYSSNIARAIKIQSAQQYLPGYAKTQAEIAAQGTTPGTGRSYLNPSTGAVVTATTKQEEDNFKKLGFKLQSADPTQTAPTPPRQPVVGFPQSSDELERWRAQGRTFTGGKWLEPVSPLDTDLATVSGIKDANAGKDFPTTPDVDLSIAGNLQEAGDFKFPDATFELGSIYDAIISKTNAIASAQSDLAQQIRDFEPADLTDALADYYTSIGIDVGDAMDSIKALQNEGIGVQKQITDLNALEANAMSMAGERAAPMSFIRGEQALIQNQYNMRRTALATQLVANASQQAVLQNNLTMARGFAQDYVELITSENTFEYNRLLDFVDANQKMLEDLDDSYMDAINFSINEAKNRLDIQTAQEKNKIKWATDTETAGAFIGVDIANLDYDEAVKMTNAWLVAHPKITDPGTPDILDGLGGDFEPGSIAQAINLAVESLKFATVSAKNDAKATMKGLLASGQLNLAKEQLNSYVRNSASATQQDVLDGKKSALRAIDVISRGLAEFEAKGGKTGIFTGLSEKALNKLGGTQSGELAEITNTISLAIIDYRRAVSGAAFTESEAKAYEAVFPSAGKTPALNLAKMNSLRNKFEADIQSFTKQRIGKTKYETIFGADTIGGAGDGNTIVVKDRKTGKYGKIPANEFDNRLHERYDGVSTDVTEQKTTGAEQFKFAPKASDIKGAPKNLFDWLVKKFK